MSQIIIHHKGAYNIYSTVSDNARFVSALTEEQLKEYIKEESGNQGLRNLPDRIKKAKETGTSSIPATSFDKLLMCNIAGKNGSKLSTKRFIKQFLTL